MSSLLARRDSPAMQAALEAVAQAGREAGALLSRSPANQWQWRCLNMAAAYRQGRDFEWARRCIRMSREWRLGRDDGHLRRAYPKTSARVLRMGLTELLAGEE
jgi:hypothetical protein